MSTIYDAQKLDTRHPTLGVYVDVSGCFELPVGPFDSASRAQDWVVQNRERLIELYGAQAGIIAVNEFSERRIA